MIQDKIFFDEKDPTGLSYNTPFTVYGSYQGRLWSKTPTGTIKYYTQNSDLSVYATTGSNSFNGNQTVTGSLTVTGGITGSVTTASYVEYAGVANKPTLVSSSAQIVGYGMFATTGSNQFNGSQAITGSLTVTGQVVAQTLNVQQVTSSIVFSSGSNIFGNSVSNTQQFTGSLQVSGSSHYVLGNMGIGTTSPDVFSRGDERNVGISVPGASDNLALALNAGGSAGRGAQIYMGQGGTRHFTISSNVTETRVGTGTDTPLILTTNDTARLTIAASTGAATFASSVTATTATLSGSASDRLIMTRTSVGTYHLAISATNRFSIYDPAADAERISITSDGNVAIGITSIANSISGTERILEIANSNVASLYLNSTTGKKYAIYSGGSGSLVTYDTTGGGAARLILDTNGNFGVGYTSPNKFGVLDESAKPIRNYLGNSNNQGRAQNYKIVRHIPVVSAGNKLIIPFTNQGNLNSNTIVKIMGHSARYNSRAPLGFSAYFAVGHLSVLSDLNAWEVNGNISSIGYGSGMNVEINFSTAYTSAEANGVFITIEYMTNEVSYSIIVPNIVLN
jgi:hypothetical protein